MATRKTKKKNAPTGTSGDGQGTLRYPRVLISGKKKYEGSPSLFIRSFPFADSQSVKAIYEGAGKTFKIKVSNQHWLMPIHSANMKHNLWPAIATHAVVVDHGTSLPTCKVTYQAIALIVQLIV